MTASNLDEVRKAASCTTETLERFQADDASHDDGVLLLKDSRIMSQYILQTIPANPTAPITPEWLREVWGFEHPEWNNDRYMTTSDGEITVCYEDQVGPGWHLWGEEDLQWPRLLKTKHDAFTLFAALGLQPKLPPAPATQPETKGE